MTIFDQDIKLEENIAVEEGEEKKEELANDMG